MFDGCSKGNPGRSGAGAVLYKDDQEIWSQSFFVGERSTNNIAEYTGLIIGLERAFSENISNLTVKGDSLLVIKQMKGEYKVKTPHILELYLRAKALHDTFNKIEYIHVLRKDNKRADELSNLAI